MAEGKSAQEIALELLRIVAQAEGVPLENLTDEHKPQRLGNTPVRQYILDGYVECLNATTGRRQVAFGDGNA